MPDYTRKPYSGWTKCIHTCEHWSNKAASRKDINFASITYRHRNKKLVAGDLTAIFFRGDGCGKRHALSPQAHAHCSPECSGHWLLGVERKTVRACDTRTPLTEQDWEEYGVGLAILQAGNRASKEIPDEYFKQALPYLEEQLPAMEYARVLQNRGIDSATMLGRKGHSTRVKDEDQELEKMDQDEQDNDDDDHQEASSVDRLEQEDEDRGNDMDQDEQEYDNDDGPRRNKNDDKVQVEWEDDEEWHGLQDTEADGEENEHETPMVPRQRRRHFAPLPRRARSVYIDRGVSPIRVVCPRAL